MPLPPLAESLPKTISAPFGGRKIGSRTLMPTSIRRGSPPPAFAIQSSEPAAIGASDEQLVVGTAGGRAGEREMRAVWGPDGILVVVRTGHHGGRDA